MAAPQAQSKDLFIITVRTDAGVILKVPVNQAVKFDKVQSRVSQKLRLRPEWLTFSFLRQPVDLNLTIKQLGMLNGDVVRAHIVPELQYTDGQWQPQPALLIMTYAQLQSEVQHGILNTHHAPFWSGRGYSVPEADTRKELPAAVREVLLLAGCGFPLEQLPGYLWMDMLANERTPADLRRALQGVKLCSRGSTGSGSASSSTAGTARTSSAHANSSRGYSSSSSSRADRALAPYQACKGSAYSSIETWSVGFALLCWVCCELRLPLAMHPRLPISQRTFLQHVDAIDERLGDILAGHRSFLCDVANMWLDKSAGRRGCVRAADYKPCNWRAPLLDPSKTAVFSIPRLEEQAVTALWLYLTPAEAAARKRRAISLDIPGAAVRLADTLRVCLGKDWHQLPWLREQGSGLVLAGLVVLDHLIPQLHHASLEIDMFIIASEEEVYDSIVSEVHEWLDEACTTPKIECDNNMAWQWCIGKKAVRLTRWPFCSPAALVRSFDIATMAAYFDGADVYLDERCAWCHANEMLLADPMFDSATSMSYCAHLLQHAHNMYSYGILMPGDLNSRHVNSILSGIATVLLTTCPSCRRHCNSALQESLTALIKSLSGMSRFLVLLACYLMYGHGPGSSTLPNFKAVAEALTAPHNHAVPPWGAPSHDLAAAQAFVLGHVSDSGRPFVGYFEQPWGGHGPRGLVRLRDKATWLTGCELEELPRRVWLARHSAHSTQCQQARQQEVDAKAGAAASHAAEDGTGPGAVQPGDGC